MSPEMERFLSTLRNHTKPILRLEQPLSNAIRKWKPASKLFLLAMLSLISLWFRVWTPQCKPQELSCLESQSWLSCFCRSQNWLLLLLFVIKKGRRKQVLKYLFWRIHISAWPWVGHNLDTIDPWLMSLAPTNEDLGWHVEVKTFEQGKITLHRVRYDKFMCRQFLFTNNKA